NPARHMGCWLVAAMRTITYSMGLLLALGALSCGGSGPPTPPPDPCGNLRCASAPGSLYLSVTDAPNGAPIANPTFSAQMASQPGNPVTVTPTCTMGSNPACTEWEFPFLDQGSDIITVTAPGYDMGSVTVQIIGPSGCCGKGPDVRQSVMLHKQ